MEVCWQYHTRGQQGIQNQTGWQGPERFASRVARVRRERGQWVDWEDRSHFWWCGVHQVGEDHMFPHFWSRATVYWKGRWKSFWAKKVVLISCNFPFIVSTNRIWVNWITNSLAVLAWGITGNAWAGLSPTSHSMGRAVGWCVSIEIECLILRASNTTTRFSSWLSNFCNFTPRLHKKQSQKVRNTKLSWGERGGGACPRDSTSRRTTRAYWNPHFQNLRSPLIIKTTNGVNCTADNAWTTVNNSSLTCKRTVRVGFEKDSWRQ